MADKFVVSVVLLLACASGVLSAKLPSYVKACSRTDPNLKQCALKNGQEAIPRIVKGDNALKIPSLEPLFIPKISFDATKELKITLTDCNIDGLENTLFKDAEFDFDKKKFTFVVFVPRLVLTGKYDINGKILILPIEGQGRANITFLGTIFTYTYEYELQEKNGKHYQNVIKNDINYEMEKAYFQLDNLFNGNRQLGEQMNTFMNENWRDVLKEIGPALGDTVAQIITSIVNGFFKKVPDSEMFLD